MLTADDAATFERTLAAGGVAVFPADTVYGLACHPDAEAAVRRLYAAKGRPPGQPSAVLFFSLASALAALPELPTRTLAAAEALLPGALTLLLDNPGRRFPLACGDGDTLGLRVPAMPPAAVALEAVRGPVLQSSANHHGRPDARRLADVPAELRAAADLVLDGGPLPGTPSTVVDLRAFAGDGAWDIARQGAVPAAEIEVALRGL